MLDNQKSYYVLKSIKNILVTSTLISSGLSLFLYFFNFDLLLQFLVYFSPDGFFSLPQIAIRRFFFFHLFVISFLLIFTRQRIIKDFLISYRETNLIHKTSITLIVFLIFFYFVFQFQPLSINLSNLGSLYEEDTGFESMTAIFLFLASVLIIFSIENKELFYSKLFKIFIALSSLLFFLEEISWGQRILDFKTPEFLLMINTQEEANIHNIFNFLFPLIYPLVSLLVFFVFFFLEKIKIKIQHLVNQSLFPGIESKAYAMFTGFIFLTCLILPSHNYDNEIMEEVFSVILLAYSLDQFRISRLVSFIKQ
jgi:hypothetical protein